MLFFGRKKPVNRTTPPQRKRHQKPVTDLRSVKRHQRREEQRIRELEKGLRERRLGLYLHIPFCVRKCAYCDFYSLPGREDRMDAYLKSLCANMTELVSSVQAHTVDTVYLGGGTPSLFGERRLKVLLNTVKKTFRLDKDCELTVECNPESVTPKLIRTLRRCGVNRISLGMQSAQDDELRAVGRVHDFEQVRTAVACIRKEGIRNLSLDLIYGLPEQSRADWQESVEAALALEPEHLSLYALTLEEGTPLWKRRDALDLADDDEQAERYLWAVDRLSQAGYAQYEISNFAKPGYESRHNLKYWMGEEYIAFGPGAHSDFGGVRYSYVADLEAYIAGVSSGSPIVEESERIPQPERFREYLIFRLRTVRGIGEEEYGRLTRMDFAPLRRRLEDFAASGWAMAEETEGERRWHFTPQGFLLSNRLIGELLEVQEEQLRGGVSGRGRPGLQDTRPVFDS
jgi:oxygen-independent coproporphyrinogen-3 oxidase